MAMQPATACLDYSDRGVCSVADPGVERASVYEDCEREAAKYKWIESEKAGTDIGFEKALLDWIVRHRSNWRQKRLKEGRGPVQVTA